jgi:hypothetical protein
MKIGDFQPSFHARLIADARRPVKSPPQGVFLSSAE